MKFLATFLLSTCLALSSISAQTPQYAVVKPNGLSTIYNSWALAYAAATNDDYIYLPGVTITSNIIIEKRLHLFGPGFLPDSSISTGKAIINGVVIIRGQASNGSMSGIDINGSTIIGSPLSGFTNKIQHYTIKRCELEGIYFDAIQDSLPEYITISENLINTVINDLFASPKGANCLISKNILLGRINSLTNSTISNNVFLQNNQTLVFGYVNNSLIQNNIIFNPDSYIFSSTYPSCYNSLLNNLKLQDTTFNACSTVIESGNIYIPSVDNIFISYESPFDYHDDFHLSPSCPGIDAGTDNTDVGIYGTNNPTPDGWLPTNPHIFFKQVDSETGSDGKLHIQIGVRANN